ncbi:MAG: ATP-binding cassette domain-containing protein [Nakamurella sp.]
MLRLRGVSVRYGEATAVDDVSIDVADGEVMALLGPSGCGKSTLLRAIAGIEPIASGEIDWDGVDLATIPVHRRGFGLMFQDGVLFPHRSVAGNVGYGLQGKSGWGIARRGADADDSQGRSHRRQDATERVVDLLHMVGLAGYGNRRVDTLSGGEAQRVALARALAPNPRLLLLDEPLAALDTSLRGTLLADLAQVLESTGTTAIFVTHDQDEAFAIADRIALMRAGRIVQVGTPHEVWSAPADSQAATFLGRDRHDGRRFDAVRVRHDASSTTDDSLLVVVAGAVIQDGKLLIARRIAPPELAGKWELPGGKVEAGETEQAALARELLEELSLAVQIGPRVGPGIPLDAGIDSRPRELRVFRAEPTTREASYLIKTTVHAEVRWIGCDDLDAVDWVPADRLTLGALRSLLSRDMGENNGDGVRRSAAIDTDLGAS